MTNRTNIALLAPNQWGQVYLSSRRTHRLDHQCAIALADDAMSAFDDEHCTTQGDLDFVEAEIARVN